MVMTQSGIEQSSGLRPQSGPAFSQQQFQSFEQLQEQSQRSYSEVRQSLTNAASSIVRYANMVRPGVNPAELLIAVDSALQTCAEATLRRIDPQTGRIRALPNPQQPWNTQQLQQQPKAKGRRR